MTARKRLAADAWGTLLRLHAALVPTLDETLRSAAGLPLSWYDVLLELASAPQGRLRMTELAGRVVLSRTRVSRVVDELAGQGMVDKQAHPDDRRSAYAAITKRGRAAFKAAAPVYLRAIEEQFATGLTETELEQVARVLGKSLARTTTGSAR